MRKKLISIMFMIVLVIFYNEMSYATGYTSGGTTTGTGYTQSNPSETTETTTTNPVENPHSSGTTTTSGTGTTVAGPYGTSGTSSTPSTSVGPYGAQIVVGEDGTAYSTGPSSGITREEDDSYSSGTSSGLLGNSDASASHTLGEIISEAANFLSKDSGASNLKQDRLQSASNTLYNILLGVGIALALIIGVYLGIKFMMSSAEDKAKVKEALIPYIAGCVVVFSAFVIWKLAILLLSALG